MRSVMTRALRTTLVPGRSAAVLILLVTTSAGCASDQRLVRENDRLRERVHELQENADQLTLRVAELEAEVRRASALASSLPEEIRANTPHVAEIRLGRLSHAGDEDEDGRPDTLVVYLHPRDGLGRFIQLVGKVSVNAALLPAEAEAVTVGRLTLGPGELRQAYRATITGIHYALSVPIDLPDFTSDAPAPEECTVRLEFEDGLTGQSFSATHTIRLR